MDLFVNDAETWSFHPLKYQHSLKNLSDFVDCNYCMILPGIGVTQVSLLMKI